MIDFVFINIKQNAKTQNNFSSSSKHATLFTRFNFTPLIIHFRSACTCHFSAWCDINLSFLYHSVSTLCQKIFCAVLVTVSRTCPPTKSKRSTLFTLILGLVVSVFPFLAPNFLSFWVVKVVFF